jgi:tetratricopeptide (TPR) repeat protein
MKYIKPAGIFAAAMVGLFCAVTGYYYRTTPLSAIVVSADDSATGLSTSPTPDALINHVVAHLQQMILVADSSDITSIARQEGLGPRSVRETVVPIRALSSGPSPVFDRKWNGVTFNFCRALGTSLKAKRFLELEIIGFGTAWRLAALLKDRPQFLARSVGSAPRLGGPCLDFEKCVDDLAEQAQRVLDYPRLLNFYIKTNTEDANRQILDLYQTTVTNSSLGADDLVAWGNAFYGLGQFDQALQKYQEALEKNGSFCPARIARGFLYYSRPHGSQVLADLRRAEADFRTGTACDQNNEFAHTNLCNTLLREWTNSPHPNSQLLVEAQQQCEMALQIKPQFVVAAVNIGYILYRQGQREAALRYFDDLSQRYPTDSALFLNYGFLLYREYLATGGDEMLKQATEETLRSWNLNHQSSYVAANNLGFFYYELGDFPQAVDFWRKANVLNTTDPDCIAGLALGVFKLGDPSAAVKLLSRAILLDPHYRDPAYLKQNNDWSNRAASDLGENLKLLSAPGSVAP